MGKHKELQIKVRNIGPIRSLDAKLAGQQNLIFARNGTGKSYITRALSVLEGADGDQDKEWPKLLVSTEAQDGKGTLKLIENGTTIGKVDLNRRTGETRKTVNGHIFHVFSEDYIDQNLRQTRYKLNGDITHEIVMGEENVTIKEKEKDIVRNKVRLEAANAELKTKFTTQKSGLKSSLKINAALRKFKQLDHETYFQAAPYADQQPVKTLREYITNYKKYTELPQDPDAPQSFYLDGLGLDWTDIRARLIKITSASSIAEGVKAKISQDPEFFRSGLRIHAPEAPCPFCEQDLNSVALQTISTYQTYFADAEAKEKDQIDEIIKAIAAAQSQITTWRRHHEVQQKKYNDLKAFFPSIKDTTLTDLSGQLDAAEAALNDLRSLLETKQKNLAIAYDLPETTAYDHFKDLAVICSNNNALIDGLKRLIENSTEERKSIQNNACDAFAWEFAQAHSAKIDEIRRYNKDLKDLTDEIEALRQTMSGKANARERVAATFKELLKRFFGDKYTFNADSFSVSRGSDDMADRGADKTLSDGEKSVLAFCYYLAQTHLKVATKEDYEKLFFIIDDPVSSLSLDYIYKIVQTLRLLRIKKTGVIVFNKTELPKSKMLILTHNSQFYNIAQHGLFDKNDIYELLLDGHGHRISKNKVFATPHYHQLQHIYAVKQASVLPDHTTANAIRSVIEGVWKFCQPDKDNFSAFLNFLNDTCKVEIPGCLLNDLSHGANFDDLIFENDLKEAAVWAIKVVKQFAPGQLKVINKCSDPDAI